MLKRTVQNIALCLIALLSSAHADTSLPELGGGYSAISSEQEYQLGEAWARMLRGNGRLYEDAQVTQYLEELTWKLVTYSELSDRRLQIIVVDNPTLNAFAVPGGIIGIHAGLLLYAENEAQLASVLAHELAHLSQRHFASQLEEQRRNHPVMLASILASILVAAADPQAGVAAIQSSLAASVSSRLAFSRQNEREADYIGMQTLAASGYDPNAMPDMFAQIQQTTRFSRTPPEFLLTHPITQARIAESQNRAARLPEGKRNSNTLDFNLVKARIQAHYADKPEELYAHYQAEKDQDNDSLRYALAYSAMELKKFDEAKQYQQAFSEPFKQQLASRLLAAELLMQQEQFSAANEQLQSLHQLYPDSQAVSFLYAESLTKSGQAAQAVKIYRNYLNNHPRDSRAWYLLAEAYGLAGDIVGVHEARIEFFLLTANVDRALQQIDFALREPQLSDYEKARFEQQKEEALQVRESLKMDF
ncbi:M48 family metalloprotease [Neptuniibacter sp. CAU 1671]|uniref:M48 family metalloprotease n=1 Tax=Neptuniibacter sp. CAU 1671 TaxID=3032593 RepID=UPI0023DA53AC|nr:M48 family metalloprotease [Neptuniibacter sp. CAU 1671]MDF2180698.1 M48 family metalloprotease [Neptuniibacter sp. CAU 1671]